MKRFTALAVGVVPICMLIPFHTQAQSKEGPGEEVNLDPKLSSWCGFFSKTGEFVDIDRHEF